MRLKDNRRRELTDEESALARRELEPFSGRRIGDIAKDNPGLLVFPQSFRKNEDKLDDNEIFHLEDSGKKIVVGNVMGFVGIGSARLEIASRFEESDGRDYFLHYLLGRVFSFSLFDWDFETSSDPALDLLALVFPHFLKKALRQGIYKEYRTRERNECALRGALDAARHLRLNTPFAGRVAFRTREHAADNALMQLVRHTVEHLRGERAFDALAHFDGETADAVRDVVAVTPSYARRERERVIGKNLRPLRHPYFSEYEPLRELCLRILRRDALKYGNDADDAIHGVLFDGAWLWEEYLATVLKGFAHPKNKTGAGRQYIFENPKSGHCYPDFYSERCVLDAKYKDKTDVDAQRQDTFQIISYLHVLDLRKGGFIVPAPDGGDFESTRRTLAGTGGELALFRLAVPQNAEGMRVFADEMSKAERILRSEIERFA
ncbi:MAG: McrC family protein [Candidatus Spyradosoma sp.]